MSRRRARSPIGMGPSPERPSSASARSAYGLFVVIEITTSMLWHRWTRAGAGVSPRCPRSLSLDERAGKLPAVGVGVEMDAVRRLRHRRVACSDVSHRDAAYSQPR